MSPPRIPPIIPGSDPGTSAPLRATASRDGVNFSVFSRHATRVELLLFNGVDDARPARAVRLNPTANRTHHYTGTSSCRACRRASSTATASSRLEVAVGAFGLLTFRARTRRSGLSQRSKGSVSKSWPRRKKL
jgi:hypothetical protein